MRADSLGGRIVGAIARDPGAESPDISASAELRIWTDAELTVRPGRLGPPRGSMLGRIVAALARTETATATAPFTLAPPEVPTEDAELTITTGMLRSLASSLTPLSTSCPLLFGAAGESSRRLLASPGLDVRLDPPLAE